MEPDLAERGTGRRRDGVVVEGRRPPVLTHRAGRRIYGWHGCGWYRYWQRIGIDHHRHDPAEAERFRQECAGKVPPAVLDVFTSMLFLDDDDDDLVVTGHRIGPRPKGPVPLDDLCRAKFESLTDKGTAHSYIDVDERLLAPLRERGASASSRSVSGRAGRCCSGTPTSGRPRSRASTWTSPASCPKRAARRGSPWYGATRPTRARRRAATRGRWTSVIDDGSHVVDEQIAAFRAPAPRLAPGGLYAVEDVWPIGNAERLAREIPGADVIDRRHVKGRADDVLVVYRAPR